MVAKNGEELLRKGMSQQTRLKTGPALFLIPDVNFFPSVYDIIIIFGKVLRTLGTADEEIIVPSVEKQNCQSLFNFF